ncbi:MAG: arsenate reductase (glutaredoxin) [Oceanicaulis sp.]
MEFWHNPRCAKSREALALLRSKGIEPEVREYLKTPPSRDEIEAVVRKLSLSSARDLMRTKEAVYKERGLAEVEDEAALIDALAEEPRLIERPVLINGPKAAIGRPAENILEGV